MPCAVKTQGRSQNKLPVLVFTTPMAVRHPCSVSVGAPPLLERVPMQKGVPRRKLSPTLYLKWKPAHLERLTTAQIRRSLAGVMIPGTEVSELEPYFMTSTYLWIWPAQSKLRRRQCMSAMYTAWSKLTSYKFSSNFTATKCRGIFAYWDEGTTVWMAGGARTKNPSK